MNLFTGSDNILMIGGGFMEDLYVTVTGFANYYHKKPFAIGNVLICVKEPSNKYDSEAITVKLPITARSDISQTVRRVLPAVRSVPEEYTIKSRISFLSE